MNVFQEISILFGTWRLVKWVKPSYDYDFLSQYLEGMEKEDPLKTWGLGKESLFLKIKKDNEIRGNEVVSIKGKWRKKWETKFLSFGMTL